MQWSKLANFVGQSVRGCSWVIGPKHPVMADDYKKDAYSKIDKCITQRFYHYKLENIMLPKYFNLIDVRVYLFKLWTEEDMVINNAVALDFYIKGLLTLWTEYKIIWRIKIYSGWVYWMSLNILNWTKICQVISTFN